MAINRIHSQQASYEVGGDITSIELTDHGNDITTIYKVTYVDGSLLFVGLREHEIEEVI